MGPRKPALRATTAAGRWGACRAAGQADVHVIVAERQRQMLAAQLRHLERRSDALTQAGGDDDAALAQSVEQAMLQLTGVEVICLFVARLPAVRLGEPIGQTRHVRTKLREFAADEVENAESRMHSRAFAGHRSRSELINLSGFTHLALST